MAKMNKKIIIIITILLIAICTSAFAIKITLFADWGLYIKRAQDIVIAQALEIFEPRKYKDGLHLVDVKILKILKGARKTGKMKIATIYSMEKDKKYLLYSLGGSTLETDFLAIPELSVVEIPKYFKLDSLEEKSLKEQITIIFKARLEQLAFEMRDREREKESLEKALSEDNKKP